MALFLFYCQTNKFTNMSNLEQKAFESANKAFGLIEDMTWDIDKEFHNYHQEAFKEGYTLCQKEYEEKLRWIPVEEKLPENKERVLVKLLRSDKSTIIVTGSVVLDSKLGVYWQSGHATQLNVTHWLSLSFL